MIELLLLPAKVEPKGPDFEIWYWLVAWIYFDFNRDVDRTLAEIALTVSVVPGSGASTFGT